MAYSIIGDDYIRVGCWVLSASSGDATQTAVAAAEHDAIRLDVVAAHPEHLLCSSMGSNPTTELVLHYCYVYRLLVVGMLVVLSF